MAAVRLAVLRRTGEPSGLDFGNWLTIGEHWLGRGAPGGSQSTYPPVVPLLTVAAVSALGPAWGTSLLAVLGGSAPAVAVWAVLRRQAPAAAAAGLALLVAAAGSTGEAVAWGGLPQLLGLGAGLLALWSLVQLLGRPSAGAAWRVGGWLLAVAGTSHLVLAQVAACAGVILLLHLVTARPGLRLRGPWLGRSGLLLLAARTASPPLLLGPLYWQLSGSVGQSFLARTDGGRLSGVLVSTGALFQDAPVGWKGAAALTAVTPVLLLRRRRMALWQLSTGMTLAVAAVTLGTGEARLAYLLPLAIATSLGLWAVEVHSWYAERRTGTRTALAVLALVALGFTAGRGLDYFRGQRQFYGDRLLPPGTTAALGWVREQTPAGSLVAVAPVGGLPVGWWVEGFGRRPTLTAASELFLNFPDERRRARLAVALFSQTEASSAQLLADSRALGVSYLYVPGGWGGLAGSSISRVIADSPWRVVFRNRAATIVWTGP